MGDSIIISSDPASSATAEPTHRPSPLWAVAVLIVAFAVIIALVLLVGGRGRDDFQRGSVAELTSALTAHGLAICSSSAPDFDQHDDGSISTQEVKVAQTGGCGNQVTVQLDDFKDASHRDAAARNAEGKSRPRTYGTVYTWRSYTIYLQADDASGDPAILDKVVDALDAVGAQ